MIIFILYINLKAGLVMSVNNNNHNNQHKAYFNAANDNSLEKITQDLFEILKKSDSEILSTENKSRIEGIFSKIFDNSNLKSDETTLAPLIMKVNQNFKTEDVRKIFIACLKKCPDAMVSSVLKLDDWKNSFTNNIDDQSLKTNAEIACKQIIECFKTNDTVLGLSSLNLPFLPDIAFTYLTHLEVLLVHSNKLTFLPKEVCTLTNLQQLNCSYNQLTSLPSEIRQLSKLWRLVFNHNQLTFLPTEIGQLSGLGWLDCSANQLTSLPTEIGQLSGLGWLNCSANQLTSLPTEIGQLSQLRQLSCSANQLTSLPTEIWQFSQLQHLDCNSNQLTSLSAAIGQLSELRRLYCHSNQLTSLPSELGQLSQLDYLVCSYNQLTSLPSELGQLSQLRLLACNSNQLQTIPDTFGNLNLYSFDCRDNFLTTLPDALLSRFGLGPQQGSHTQSSNIFNNNTSAPTNGLKAFQQATQDPSLKKLDLSFLESSEQPELYGNVLQWLDKLKIAQEYKNEKTRSLFATQVLSILQLANNNPEYLEILKVQLIDVLSSCVDRAATAINYLELQKMVLESKNESIENVMKLLKSGLALEVLDKFAKEFMKQHPDADEIEVYLGLKMKLKDALGLPTLGSMNFFGCSDLTDKDLLKAEALVRDAWKDMEMATAYFLSQEAWIDKLKTAYRIELDKHLEPVNDELEQLTEGEDKLTSENYKKKMDLLQAEHKRLEKEWLRTKTIELLKTASSTEKEGNHSLETLIGILRNSSTLKSEELIKAVASLDSPILGKIYYHVYAIAKNNKMNTNHVDFGKVAFCKQNGFDVPDALRLKAIQKGILDALVDMIKQGKRNGVLALISKLPVDIENRIYGEVYCIEKKNGKNVSHWDFGRAAFHKQDGKDVTDEVRILALRNVSDQI